MTSSWLAIFVCVGVCVVVVVVGGGGGGGGGGILRQYHVCIMKRINAQYRSLWNRTWNLFHCIVSLHCRKPHAIYNFDIISDHFKTTEKFIKPPSNHVQLVRYVYIHAWRHHTNARWYQQRTSQSRSGYRCGHAGWVVTKDAIRIDRFCCKSSLFWSNYWWDVQICKYTLCTPYVSFHFCIMECNHISANLIITDFEYRFSSIWHKANIELNGAE